MVTFAEIVGVLVVSQKSLDSRNLLVGLIVVLV